MLWRDLLQDMTCGMITLREPLQAVRQSAAEKELLAEMRKFRTAIHDLRKVVEKLRKRKEGVS